MSLLASPWGSRLQHQLVASLHLARMTMNEAMIPDITGEMAPNKPLIFQALGRCSGSLQYYAYAVRVLTVHVYTNYVMNHGISRSQPAAQCDEKDHPR